MLGREQHLAWMPQELRDTGWSQGCREPPPSQAKAGWVSLCLQLPSPLEIWPPKPLHIEVGHLGLLPQSVLVVRLLDKHKADLSFPSTRAPRLFIDIVLDFCAGFQDFLKGNTQKDV